MSISRQRLDYMAFVVYRAIKENPLIEVRKPDAVVGAVRRVVAENVRQEAELEKEAEAALRAHRSEILRSDADYRRMIRDGARILAKKKGIPL